MASQTVHELIEDDSQKHMPFGYATQATWDNSRIRSVKRVLSSAEILNLDTTPITLVAAPGAGKMLIPLRVTANLVYGTSAYVAGTDYITLNIGTYATGLFLSNSFIQSSSNYITANAQAGFTNSYANLANKSLNLTATGSISAGDSTIEVTLHYLEVTL